MARRVKIGDTYVHTHPGTTVTILQKQDWTTTTVAILPTTTRFGVTRWMKRKSGRSAPYPSAKPADTTGIALCSR